jgi:hypothetical protein
MNITVLNNKKTLTSIDIDIESLLAQSERETGTDPVAGTFDKVLASLANENISVDGVDAKSLQKALSTAIATGNFEGSIQIQGSPMKRSFFKGKNDEMEHPSLQQARKVFDGVTTYPNPAASTLYDSLIGLDDIKSTLTKEASLLISPELLEVWSKKHHRKLLASSQVFKTRPPLIVFAGDVGTGKTALAETFGNEIAKQMKTPTYLLRVSVQTRGTGLVGEMTQLIHKAFHEAKRVASELGAPFILLIDEADTLAQSREETQMHHEDKAGVNALIQGIDHVRDDGGRILVVFCTNRLGAVDPAIMRRAAIVHRFTRPTQERLERLFQQYFGDLGLTKEQFAQLMRECLPNDGREYGFTYSDIVNRVIPAAVLRAYPDRALQFSDILETVQSVMPTPPFREEVQQ